MTDIDTLRPLALARHLDYGLESTGRGGRSMNQNPDPYPYLFCKTAIVVAALILVYLAIGR